MPNNQTDPLGSVLAKFRPYAESNLTVRNAMDAALNAEIAKARIDLIKWTIHHLGVEGEDWTIDWLKAQLTTPEEGKENE